MELIVAGSNSDFGFLGTSINHVDLEEGGAGDRGGESKIDPNSLIIL